MGGDPSRRWADVSSWNAKMRILYKLLSLFGDAKAATKGPAPFAKRQVRKFAHKSLAKVLRRFLK